MPGAPCARGIRYNPSEGKPWRSGVTLPVQEATKVIKAANRAGLSVNALLIRLIQQMPVDADGHPRLDSLAHQQEETPLAG